jgi:hypothetical protein
MAKTKGIVLGDIHKTPRTDASQRTGYGQSGNDLGRAVADLSSHYPEQLTAHSAHPTSETKETRYHAGNPDTVSGHNVPEGSKGQPMGDLERDAPQGKPVVVDSKDRQMPDRRAVSKAQEVADELHKHGDGEGPSGTLSR